MGRFGTSATASAFFAPVVAQALLTLGATPFLVRAVGLEGYSAIAVGQSIGAIAWILLSIGYHVTGPVQVALVEPKEATNLLLRSMATRVALAPFVALATIVLCAATSPASLELAIGFALPTAAGGLISSWFFSGAADPRGSLLFEALPRLIPMFVGLLCIVAFESVWFYPLGQSLGVAASIAMTFFYARERAPHSKVPTFHACLSELRSQMTPTLISVGQTILLSAPLLIMTAGQFAIVQEFAILDKLQKQAAGASAPLASVLLSRAAAPWQPTPLNQRITSVTRRNAMAIVLIGVALTLVGALLAGSVGRLLSAGLIHLGSGEAWVFSLWVSSTIMVQAWQPCVLALTQRQRQGLLVLGLTGGVTLTAVALTSALTTLTHILILLSVGQILFLVLTTGAIKNPQRLRR